MPKLNGILIGREQVADATWAFRLDPKATLPYKPGQTIDLTIPHPMHQDELGNKRTFSLAAAPEHGKILIATRVRGSAFKRSLLDGPLGMAVDVEGPFGSFTLPSKPSRVVLLAGGIGITPFRAMAEDAILRRLDHSILLVHSNRTPEETPFLGELRDWSAGNPGFRYLPTMTRVEQSRMPWAGERRRVGPELLADILPSDRSAPIYYVAGPERFVKGAAESLKAVGVDEDRVRTEEFPGY